MNIPCEDCGYYYQKIEDGEDYAACHWFPRCAGDLPPCEEDD